jgi:hypothetical protein
MPSGKWINVVHTGAMQALECYLLCIVLISIRQVPSCNAHVAVPCDAIC